MVRCIHGDRNVIIKNAICGPHFLNFFTDFTQLGYHDGVLKRCGSEKIYARVKNRFNWRWLESKDIMIVIFFPFALPLNGNYFFRLWSKELLASLKLASILLIFYKDSLLVI